MCLFNIFSWHLHAQIFAFVLGVFIWNYQNWPVIRFSFSAPFHDLTSQPKPHLPISHTCMPFTCNQLQYLGGKSTHTHCQTGLCIMHDFPAVFPAWSPSNQPASLSLTLTRLCRLIPRNSTCRLSPTTDICLRLHWFLFLIKASEEFEIVGLCPNYTNEATPHLRYIIKHYGGSKIWSKLKSDSDDFDTQMIYLFSSFFRMWTWSQAGSHVAGKLPCAALTEDKSLRVGGLRWKDARSCSEKNTCQKVLHSQPLPKNKQKSKERKLQLNEEADVCRCQIGILWSRGFLMETKHRYA